MQKQVPPSWCLFQPVEHFLQAQDVMFLSLHDKPFRLLHVHTVLGFIEERRLDIKLHRVESEDGGNGEHKPKQIEVQNWRSGLVVVNTLLLLAAKQHESSLEALSITIGLVLDRPEYATANRASS